MPRSSDDSDENYSEGALAKTNPNMKADVELDESDMALLSRMTQDGIRPTDIRSMIATLWAQLQKDKGLRMVGDRVEGLDGKDYYANALRLLEIARKVEASEREPAQRKAQAEAAQAEAKAMEAVAKAQRFNVPSGQQKRIK